MGPQSSPDAATRLAVRSRARLAGWLGWVSLALLAAWRYAGRAADDIYITYRYAYNLAAGRGLVFNPGERVFGVSDPGVAVVLAALHRATGVPIPTLGTAITAVALLGIAGTLLAAARRAGREAEAWAGGTLLLSSAYVWLGQGAGPLPALALLLGAALWAGAGRPAAAGAVAGVAFCCRPDAALGAGCLTALLAIEGLRRVRPAAAGSGEPAAGARAEAGASGPVAKDGPIADADKAAARSGAAVLRELALGLLPALTCAMAFAAVATVALIAAWGYFGHALPETLWVKQQFAALKPRDFVGRAFWQPAAGLFASLAGPGGVALLALGAAGQPVLFRRGGWPGRLLVLDSLVTAAFYTAARVPYFLWYTLVSAVAMLYGACLLGGELARRGLAPADAADAEALERRGRAAGRALLVGVSGLVGLAAAGCLVAGVRWWSAGGNHDWRLTAYRTAGEWVRGHTPAGAGLVFDEVGIISYYSDRPVLDLIGLVSRSSRPYAAVGDPLGAFLAAPTELVVFHTYNPRGGTRPIHDRPWFAAAFAPAAVLADRDVGAEMIVYRRRPGSAIPPPRPPLRRSTPVAASVP